MRAQSLSEIKTNLEIAQSLLIILGVAWSYYNYIYKRERFPRAHFSCVAASFKVPGGSFLTVTVEIKNIGSQLLRIGFVEVRIQQILPLYDDYMPPYHPPIDGISFGWPALEVKCRNFERGEILEIEPGEVHPVTFDFLLPETIELIRIYAYTKNIKKAKKEFGWEVMATHTLPRNEGG
jgi:hypothetical protein